MNLSITIDLSRPLTKDEQNHFANQLDEWLYNEFQDWDDNPFGDLKIGFPVKKSR